MSACLAVKGVSRLCYSNTRSLYDLPGFDVSILRHAFFAVLAPACNAALAQPPAAPAGVCGAPAEQPVAQLTPLVMQPGQTPLPVRGGDGRYHLVYELSLQNFSGERVRAERIQVLDGRTGAQLASLDAATLATRLVVRDRQAVAGEFAASQLGILYLHVVIDHPEDLPVMIGHRLTMSLRDQTVTATAACTNVAPATGLLLDAPLRGARFIAGDGCCDSTRHIRATLPLGSTAYDAQRFAI
ncbi:MAG: hypothetical protein JO184_04445, partial [Gammaproteobacteria bacterium]|nr:hypothetical protein [Gammaproteobacteria bacterium]